MTNKQAKRRRLWELGMSPVELLICVCTIGALLLLVTILIDKSIAIKRARDILRSNQIQRILGGILEYQIDFAGAFPAEILPLQDGKAQMIAMPGHVCTNVCPNQPVLDECVDLGKLLPKYMAQIPQDPFFTELGPAGYYVYKRHANVITVGACVSEAAPILETTR